MHDSFNNFVIQKVETITLPQVKRFYRENGMRAQAAKIDEVYVLKHQQKILAALRLCPIDDVWLLRSMCVASSYRGQGIGSYFLSQLQTVLSHKTCYSFPYEHLQGFYRAHGFEVCCAVDVVEVVRKRFNHYIEKGKKVSLMKHLDVYK